MTWWNNDWSYRLRVKVDSDFVDSNLTDVPLWVRLRDGNFDFSRTTTSGGEEIRFVDYNNIQIPHEITQWNTTSGIADIWVKFSEVSSTEDSYVWMYYGNSTASGVPPVEVPSDIINDDFLGTTLSGIWTWDSGTGGSYTVSGSNLRITSGSGDIWASYDPTWAYQSNISGDFDIWTKINAPDIDTNYEQAGILIEVDSINFWKLARIYYSGSGGDLVYFANRVGGSGDTTYESPVAYALDIVYLRMRRIDDKVYAYYKAAEEDNWIPIPRPTNTLSSSSNVNIGFFANHPLGSQFIAEFDWIMKTNLLYSTGVWSDYDLVYHLNEDILDGTAGQVIDSSPLQNHGTSTGHPTPKQVGVVGYSTYHDGSDYITSNALSNVTGSDYRTTSLWFKPTTADQGSYPGLFTYGAVVTDAGWNLLSAINNADFYFMSLWGAVTDSHTWIAVDPSEGWNHWAMKWDGTDWQGFYNGNVMMSRSDRTPNTTASIYYIGRYYQLSVDCIGYLDEVRMATKALDDDEIKVQYLNMAEHDKIMTYLPAVVSGTLADKYGNPISGVPVKIISYDKDTLEIMDYTTVSGNGYEIGATSSGTEVLVSLSFEGSFGGDTNIAGAEFRTPIIWGG